MWASTASLRRNGPGLRKHPGVQTSGSGRTVMMQQCSVGPQLFHMNRPVFSSYTHTHRNTHTNRKPHTHTKSHTHTKPHIHTNTHVLTYTKPHTHTHTHTKPHTHTNHAHKHTHKHTHKHIHTNPLRIQRGRTCHLLSLVEYILTP